MKKAEGEEGRKGSPKDPEAAERERQEGLPSLFPEPLKKPEFVKPPAAGWLEKEKATSETEFERRFGMSLKEAAQKIALSKRQEIGGPVKVSAIYELKQEKTLADLLRMAGGLGDQAFKGRVQVLRVKDHRELVFLTKICRKFWINPGARFTWWMAIS